MIPSNVNDPAQAFPIKTTTAVFSSGVGAYEVKDNLLVHMNEAGRITCYYNSDATPGSIVIDADAGSDWAISNNFDSIEIDASCIITHM